MAIEPLMGSYFNITNIHKYYQLTSVTSHVYFEATSLVVCLVAARISTCEVARFSEVSSIVGKQGTEGDEGFLTACAGQSREHVGRKH